MRMNHRSHTRRGFTLVEVIVVLVILAVLAAIMVPAMTGWIDKAKQKRMIVECRTCVTAAQTLVAEDYGATGNVVVPTGPAVLALARIEGTVSNIGFQSNGAATNPKTIAQIAHLTYSNAAGSVTYCADASCGDYYNFSKGAGGTSGTGGGTGTLTEANVGAAMTTLKGGGLATYDSGAMASPTHKAADMAQKLKEQGIDLAALGAVSWRYDQKNNLFYWTDVDIANLNPGTKICVMRRRQGSGTDNGTWTVWEATVQPQTDKGITYNIIKEGKLLSTKSQAADQTYSQMQTDYADAVATEKYANKQATD